MKGNILLIDDNPIDLKVASLAIEKHGYTCHGYTDFQKGLEWAKSQDPQMIFLDLQMPNISGYDLIQKFRQSTETAFIPIVIISGKNQLEDIKKAVALGANDYIVKPLDPLIIQEKLQKIDLHNQQTDFHQIDLPTHLIKTAFFAHPLQITAVSEFGVKVTSDAALLPGETVQILELNPEIFGSDRLFLRCLSCDRLNINGKYAMQMTYIGVTETQRQHIRKSCRQLWIEMKKDS